LFATHNLGVWVDSKLIAVHPKTHEFLSGHDTGKPYGKADGY